MSEAAFNLKSIWKPILTTAAIAFLFGSVLLKLGNDWWTDENYSHGLLVPFVIGFIVWSEFELLKNAPKKSSTVFGGALILFALLLLLAGTLGAELFLQRISFVVMLAGIVVYFFGLKIIKYLSVPFLLLLLAIPIPQIIFNKIAFPLQIWASQLAIWGIRLFQVSSVRNGNVIEILPKGATQTVSLEVVEACSGIRSLMTLVTLALILAYFTPTRKNFVGNFWKNPDVWRAIILMFSAIPIAILTNAARVTATGVLTFQYGKKAADGFTHELSGWLVYIVAFVLLLTINAVLKIFLRARFKAQDSEKSEQVTNYFSIKSVSVAGLVLVLTVGGIFINWFENRGELQVSRKELREIPLQIGDWQARGKDIRFSEQTESILRTSDYVMRDYFSPDGRRANLYVGYYASQKTGATYHSPQNCLPGSGWEMKNPESVEIRTPSGKSFTANRYIIVNDNYKEVLIYWYQGRGRAVASEYNDKIYTVWDGIFRRRSDGAMIRVMTPATGFDDTEALAEAVDLSAQIAENLSQFVPD